VCIELGWGVNEQGVVVSLPSPLGVCTSKGCTSKGCGGVCKQGVVVCLPNRSSGCTSKGCGGVSFSSLECVYTQGVYRQGVWWCVQARCHGVST
jgi:hypothetical protein